MANLIKVPTLPLLLFFGLTIGVSYLIAWLYRNDYGIKKIIYAYGLYLIPFLILNLIFHLLWILWAGIYLVGIVVLIFRNQHYFDR